MADRLDGGACAAVAFRVQQRRNAAQAKVEFRISEGESYV